MADSPLRDHGQYKPIFRFVSDDGTATGGKDMAVDGSGTPDEFWYTPPSGSAALLTRAVIHYVDSGSFDSGNFGNGIAMTNGIDIKITNSSDTVLLDLLDGNSIITNVDWGRVCYDITVSAFGAGNEALSSRWTFQKSGQFLRLNTGDKFKVTINDDLTGLVEFSIMVQGIEIEHPGVLKDRHW